MKQEREARRVISQLDEKKVLSHNLTNFLSNPLLRGETFYLYRNVWLVSTTDIKASDLQHCSFPPRPTKLRADIFHKNSFYYNQEATENTHLPSRVTEHCCAWKECRTKFLCSSDLLKHVQEDHLSCLPLNDYQSHSKLTCQWRKCSDTRCYPARYKLLLHVQKCHCKDKRLEKVHTTIVERFVLFQTVLHGRFQLVW